MMYFLRKLAVSVIDPIRKRYLFVLGVIGWVIVLGILTPILLGLIFLMLGNLLAGWQIPKTVQVGDIVLFITAAFVLAYTYETKKLREESIFQNQMSSAIDIRFRMTGNYSIPYPNRTTFAELGTSESLHNVSRFNFLTTFSMKPIGRCGSFERFRAGDPLRANYFIETDKDRKKFLNTLRMQEGEIRAGVLMSDGTRFVYTYQATTEGWKHALQGHPNMSDTFALIKKELWL